MRRTITVRHTEIPTELRERADHLLDRLEKHAHRPKSAEVIFDDDNRRKVVELHVFLPRSGAAIATAEAVDFQTALDLAAEKLKHQLDVKRDRVTDKRRNQGKRGAEA